MSTAPFLTVKALIEAARTAANGDLNRPVLARFGHTWGVCSKCRTPQKLGDMGTRPVTAINTTLDEIVLETESKA